MENTLANAEVVDDEDISVHEVGVGSTIEIKRTDRDKVEKFKIVGTTEADPLQGKSDGLHQQHYKYNNC